ncbi:phage holin family protein [Nocardioides sp. LHG3406-4]|uniref:phage holin family protein n=1 Tax=Nocardioides sp. LHG3406-4 TaxID=2804575 RepID=UPI003CF295FD
MRFVTWLVSTAAAVAVAAWLLDDIWFDGPNAGLDEVQEKIVPLLLVSLILGAVSVFVEPVVKILSLPFIVLTIGLFLLVINALMLMLTAWIAGHLDIGFHVEGFWAALLGGLVITIVNGFIDIAVLDD